MNLTSDFAIISVKRDRAKLAKHFESRPSFGPCPDNLRIPINLTGYIDGVSGRDDGIDQEFTVTVTSLTQNLTPSDNLAARCSEIMNWRKTGLLEGDQLRNLAREIQTKFQNVLDFSTCLHLAEKQTTEEAMTQVLTRSNGDLVERLINFVSSIAEMSLPEEEFETEGFSNVDEYIADLSDERLCGEYATAMDTVRQARELMK